MAIKQSELENLLKEAFPNSEIETQKLTCSEPKKHLNAGLDTKIANANRI